MRRFFAVLLIFLIASPARQSAHAQSAIDVTELVVAYHFGEQVNIQAKLNAPSPITDVIITLRAQGEASSHSDHVPVQPDGRINYTDNLAQNPLRSFARVNFWFHVTLQNGQQSDTAPFYFYYNDDRFPWQTVEDNSIRIHWVAGDRAFAQEALDAARGGLQKTGSLLSVTPDHPLDIYIYQIAADLQTALEIGGENWSQGHASPDLGVALVAISPGLDQGVQIESKIPHELAHLLTYQITGAQYNQLPVWLREGIASMAEAPNPDYPRAISLAVEQQATIPLAELCGSFPPEMSRITLAYAESESFTRFIVSQYGSSGLVKLIHAYMDGLDCEQGPAQALGNPLHELENEWGRSSFGGVSNSTAALAGLTPYLGVLLVMLLIPLGFVAALWRSSYGNHAQRPRK